MKRFLFIFLLSQVQASCAVPDDIWDRLMHKGYSAAATCAIAGSQEIKAEPHIFWELTPRFAIPPFTLPAALVDYNEDTHSSPEIHVQALIDEYLEDHDLEEPLHRLLENTYLANQLRCLANLSIHPTDVAEMALSYTISSVGKALFRYHHDVCHRREQPLVIENLVLRPDCAGYWGDIVAEITTKLEPYSGNPALPHFITDIINYNVNRDDYILEMRGMDAGTRAKICAYLDYLVDGIHHCCAIASKADDSAAAAGMGGRVRYEDDCDSSDDSAVGDAGCTPDSPYGSEFSGVSEAAQGGRTPDRTEASAGEPETHCACAPAALLVGEVCRRPLSPLPSYDQTASHIRFAANAVRAAHAHPAMAGHVAVATVVAVAATSGAFTAHS